MLSSQNRLSTSLFKEVIQKGIIFHGDFFLARCLNMPGISRFSVSVPKKVAKTAVLRNKIRRRIYSILRSLGSKIYSNKSVVLIMKVGSDKIAFPILKLDIEKAFVKNEIIK
jgi:ribonuclease P protein component